MLDFCLSHIKETYLFSFAFYKIINFEFAMDYTASILINTALSKNDFMPLLPDNQKIYFSKFIFKNITQEEKEKVGENKILITKMFTMFLSNRQTT